MPGDPLESKPTWWNPSEVPPRRLFSFLVPAKPASPTIYPLISLRTVQDDAASHLPFAASLHAQSSGWEKFPV